MQWQRKPQYDDEPPLPAFAPDSSASFLQQHARRRSAGYSLKTLGYFSKSFDATARRWASFDKEASAVLLACQTWHRLITGRPTTLYTDNTVAASILTNYNHPRPPKLQRWGVELGTYLPYLRIAYRVGQENYVADHLSRYAADPEYIKPTYHDDGIDTKELDDDLFQRLVSFNAGTKRYTLVEAKAEQAVRDIWAGMSDSQGQHWLGNSDYRQPSWGQATPIRLAPLDVSEGTPDREKDKLYDRMIEAFVAQQQDDDLTFAREHEEAEEELDHWEQYISAFHAT